MPSYGSFDWVCQRIENYKKHMFPNVDLPLWKYFNLSIIICNEKHKEFYDKIVKYYLKIEIILLNYKRHMGWELDQPILNFVQSENIDTKFLPYKWNKQDMSRNELFKP